MKVIEHLRKPKREVKPGLSSREDGYNRGVHDCLHELKEEINYREHRRRTYIEGSLGNDIIEFNIERLKSIHGSFDSLLINK